MQLICYTMLIKNLKGHSVSKFNIKNESMCLAAFKEIYCDNGGRYRLCCHSRPLPKIKDWDDSNVLPFDYFFSNEMEEIRDKMYNGEKIPECKTCYQIEENSGTSYREKYFLRHGLDDEIRDITLKVRMFGSYCNLSCYMCHPYNSSTRRKELSDVFTDGTTEFNRFIKKELEQKNKVYKKADFEAYIKNVLDHIHLIGRFQMMGGETLQLPKYWEFLERIPDEHAKNITVSQDTNLTSIEYKGKTIFDLLSRYKTANIGISVDHFGLKNEFIRYPIDHQSFENNLKRVLDKKKLFGVIQLNCTVSMLNIDDIREIELYYIQKFSLKPTFHNIIRGPSYLSIRNLPETVKKEYYKKYKEFPFILSELKKPNDRPIEDTIDYCDILAKSRNTEWQNLWSNFLQKLKNNPTIIAKC